MKKELHDPASMNDASPSDAGEEFAPRRSNGQFAPSHSGNPKGRPAKRKTSLKEDFDRVLDRKSPVSNPAFADMTMKEGIVYSLCLQAYKSPQTALKLLALVLSLPAEPSVGDGEVYDEGLDRFIERQIRQRQVRQGRTASAPMSDNADIDDDDGNAP